MHIAAAFPLALNEDGLDPELSSASARSPTEKAAESGKPADIIAKMVEGAIAKYRKENALVSQLFVMDGKTQIADVVANAAKEAGTADRADGLCPLPARRRHREGSERLRRRSRRGLGRAAAGVKQLPDRSGVASECAASHLCRIALGGPAFGSCVGHRVDLRCRAASA